MINRVLLAYWQRWMILKKIPPVNYNCRMVSNSAKSNRTGLFVFPVLNIALICLATILIFFRFIEKNPMALKIISNVVFRTEVFNEKYIIFINSSFFYSHPNFFPPKIQRQNFLKMSKPPDPFGKTEWKVKKIKQ